VAHPGLAALTARVATAVERRAGHAAADPRLTDTLARLQEDHVEGADAELCERLDALADVFGIAPVDVDLLLAAAAPDLDANVALAYGLLRGTDGPGRASVGLVLELADLPTLAPDGFVALAEAAPLRDHGLVDVVGHHPWLLREVVVPDRVVAHLAGAQLVEEALQAALVPSVPVRLPGVEAIESAITSGAPLVWVRATAGTAGLALAAGALHGLGLGRLTVDLARVPPLTIGPTLRAAALEAALRGVGLVVVGADLLGQPGMRGELAHLEATPVPAILVGTRPWDADWLAAHPFSVEAPRLGHDDRARLWEDLTGAPPPDGFGALRLSPEATSQVDRYSRLLAASEGRPEAADVDVMRAARVVGGSHVAGKRPVLGFDDVVLPPAQAADLRRIVDWARHHDEALARSGMFEAERKGGGIAALFSGGPGTGKTLSASVVAGELGLDLFQVNLSQVVDKYIGETEKNLERIFDQAESMNVVLLFDEADALFGKRSEVKDAHDRYANQEVAYLLQRLEQFDGIVLLSTNLRGNLDSAFTRRLQFLIHFPDPDAPTRRRLWELHLGRVEHLDPDDPIDLDHLAHRIEVAGGDLKTIVLAAVYDATAAGEPLGMRHLLAAAPEVYRKLGFRLPTDGFRTPPAGV
jgi:hypothetical protein